MWICLEKLVTKLTALMPQMTVVEPILTSADPSAVDIESRLIIVGRNS